ncbi:baculoviral IAP repeat-containing protein 7-B-like [Pecten maximus]|uniref:baculoviral IAP repeat-containing protein 7-B-like n=1 Tax=Pecten maximus TaxID=6579 RepID=UPI001458D2E8|nr:baculoviral IAP repeat-containing protein 7-B-like [Pecten maximus]
MKKSTNDLQARCGQERADSNGTDSTTPPVEADMQHDIHSTRCSFMRKQTGQVYLDSIQVGLPTPDAQMDPLDDQVSEQPDAQMGPMDDQVSEQPQSTQEELDMKLLLEENKRLKKQRHCCVCEKEERKIMYLPCTHLACCEICDRAQLICPICKEKIKGSRTIFWS